MDYNGNMLRVKTEALNLLYEVIFPYKKLFEEFFASFAPLQNPYKDMLIPSGNILYRLS